MVYHGIVRGPNGQTYQCEHNHRTETAAITCANSSGTRAMASMVWQRAAAQAAQAAALAKIREEERAAAQARRIAAEEAAAARRAAAKAAAEEAKAAKRAAKLAAMPPRRAWRRMTQEERLLKTAEGELEVYSKIISDDAKAAYEARAAQRAASSVPGQSSTPPTTSVPPPTAETDRADQARTVDMSRYRLAPLPVHRENADRQIRSRPEPTIGAAQRASHTRHEVPKRPQESPRNRADRHMDRSPIGRIYRHIGIEITLLNVSSTFTVPMKQYRSQHNEDLQAGDGAKFVVVKTEVLNDSMVSIDLTCSLPVFNYLFDDRGRRFDSLGKLYQIAGNPECNYNLQPGFSIQMTWVYRVPRNANIAAFEFEDMTDFSRERTVQPTRIALAGAF